MRTYQIYIQYQAIEGRHRCSSIIYVRALSEEDALDYALRVADRPTGYTVRRVNVMEEIIVHEVKYENQKIVRGNLTSKTNYNNVRVKETP